MLMAGGAPGGGRLAPHSFEYGEREGRATALNTTFSEGGRGRQEEGGAGGEKTPIVCYVAMLC